MGSVSLVGCGDKGGGVGVKGIGAAERGFAVVLEELVLLLEVLGALFVVLLWEFVVLLEVDVVGFLMLAFFCGIEERALGTGGSFPGGLGCPLAWRPWDMVTQHHGLRWDDGHTPVQDFPEILRTITRNAKVVYVKGTQKQKFLENELWIPVRNIDGPKLPRTLLPSCFHHGRCRAPMDLKPDPQAI
ncbi:hypothetical protein ILUMI_19649 [Ignelater luminosus]|uniref:Uncharacterized protein n=1 Tax=Ignelater luminosus TaxID=2038154 RepID=A0A8K0CFS7_IGNLU|nr:hypothetical protein ILUMI_19649 [Ignelater luminosus]